MRALLNWFLSEVSSSSPRPTPAADYRVRIFLRAANFPSPAIRPSAPRLARAGGQPTENRASSSRCGAVVGAHGPAGLRRPPLNRSRPREADLVRRVVAAVADPLMSSTRRGATTGGVDRHTADQCRYRLAAHPGRSP